MEFTDFPDEIIIVIVEFIKPGNGYYDYEMTRCKDEQKGFPLLYSVYDLVCTCKRFDFLRYESFLIYDDGIYDELYRSVNYLGLCNGPQYRRYYGIWSGYIDEEITIKCVMERSNYGYYNILEEECDMEDTEFEKLCSEIYQSFNDLEILEFIHDYENKKKKGKIILIRKQFPKLNIPRLEEIIKLNCIKK